MMDVQKYTLQKVERIMQLNKWGFNIPRMAYYPQAHNGYFKEKNLQRFLDDNPHVKKFNIRTYVYDVVSGKEGWSSKHYVGIPKKDLPATLKDAVRIAHCMVDAEVPEHGLYAGNIVIEDDGYCILEYCHKECAMVREADRSSTGFIDDMREGFEATHPKLCAIIDKARAAPRNIVLEWSVLKKPGGIELDELIWWEYRNWLPMAR
jgi:hypothetical protein